jgi:hypothetical protein
MTVQFPNDFMVAYGLEIEIPYAPEVAGSGASPVYIVPTPLDSRAGCYLIAEQAKAMFHQLFG